MAKDVTAVMTKRVAESPTSTTRPLLDKSKANEEYWPATASKDQIPLWLRDNDYIINGHPMPTHSYVKSGRLWRCLHMETMNIWTHFVGAIGVVATAIGLYSCAESRTSKPTSGDKLAFSASLITAAICFTLSATFHTLRSHSYNVHHFWGRLDIMGICSLAVGAGASATYYAFYDDPKARRIYWGLNLFTAVAAAIALFDTGGGGSKMRALRGGMFTGLAVSALFPIFHGIGLLGWTQACTQIGGQWFLAEGLVLLVGVILFVGRLPERLKPGSFDIWGHSHQLWHICAVIATACHFVALVTGYRYIHSID